MDETDKKIAAIFEAAKRKEDEQRRQMERIKQEQAAARKVAVEHLNGVIEPELRRLAPKIQAQGLQVDVSRGKLKDAAGDDVTITIYPKGSEHARREELPYLCFIAANSGISVHEHAMAPGRGGHSGGLSGFPAGTKSTAKDVENAVLRLLEYCFGAR